MHVFNKFHMLKFRSHVRITNQISSLIARLNVGKVCFCKSTDKLKLFILLRCKFSCIQDKLSIYLLPQCCSYALVRFLAQSHMDVFRGKKSWFCLKKSKELVKNLPALSPETWLNIVPRSPKNVEHVFLRKTTIQVQKKSSSYLNNVGIQPQPMMLS